MRIESRSTIICCAMLLISSVICAAGPRSLESDRAAIVALEHDWLDHLSDASILNRALADDFVHPVPQGMFLSKQEHIDWAIKHPYPATRKAEFEKLDVRVYGDTAIANGIVESTEAPSAKPRRSIFTDVFVYRSGRWQAVNAQENAIVEGQ